MANVNEVPTRLYPNIDVDTAAAGCLREPAITEFIE
jgi:hypothetical protein